MSRWLTQDEDGNYIQEIESMEVCKWKINEVCCNDQCDCLADYPYPYDICYEENLLRCKYFEKENGIIGE